MFTRVFITIFILLPLCSCWNSPLKSPKSTECFKNTPVYELALAVSNEDTVEMRRILADSIDLDYQNRIWEMSVLDMAVLTKKNVSVEFLMKNGANPFLNKKRQTAFSLAAQTDNIDCLETIIKYGDIDTIPVEIVRFSLHDAYFDGDETFDFLTKKGIQYRDTAGTILYNAVYFMNYDYTLELLKCGVVFNDSVAYGYPDLLNGEVPQTISYLLLNKKGFNFDSTPEFILDRRRNKLIEYLRKENILKE